MRNRVQPQAAGAGPTHPRIPHSPPARHSPSTHPSFPIHPPVIPHSPTRHSPSTHPSFPIHPPVIPHSPTRHSGESRNLFDIYRHSMPTRHSPFTTRHSPFHPSFPIHPSFRRKPESPAPYCLKPVRCCTIISITPYTKIIGQHPSIPSVRRPRGGLAREVGKGGKIEEVICPTDSSAVPTGWLAGWLAGWLGGRLTARRPRAGACPSSKQNAGRLLLLAPAGPVARR